MSTMTAADIPAGSPIKKLMEMTESPASILAQWSEIREEIWEQFKKAETDTQRELLLELRENVLDLVEAKLVTPEQLPSIKEAREKEYRIMLTLEFIVDGSVCVETWNKVTLREVAAGRMTPDHEMRKNAASAMHFPHFSRAELLEQMANKKKPVEPMVPKWRQLLEAYGGLIITAAFYLGVPWALFRLGDNDSTVFWLVLGALIVMRLAFAVVKLISEEFTYRLTRGRRVAQILAFLKENQFPDPNGEAFMFNQSYYSYMHAIAIGEMFPADLRTLAQREDTYTKTVEPLQDFMARIRFHSPLDEAMRKYKSTFTTAKN